MWDFWDFVSGRSENLSETPKAIPHLYLSAPIPPPALQGAPAGGAVLLFGGARGWLIRLHWLTEDEAGDKQAVGRAVGALVAASARR